jgi:ATP-dependent protease ClpP protease subunit
MGEETNATMCRNFIKNLHMLEDLSSDPILVIANNVGGDELHGMGIYDSIRASTCYITLKIVGHAMSMGSIIAQAADKRVMMPNARFMLHYGTAMLTDSDMEAKTQYRWITESKKFDSMMENLFLSRIREKNPNYSMHSLKKLLDRDTILDAEESLSLGLVDEIVQYKVVK